MPPNSTWRALRTLGDTLGARLLVNLKLSGGDLGFITDMYERAILELGPHIYAFELGNEPLFWPKSIGGWSPAVYPGNWNSSALRVAAPNTFDKGWEAYGAYFARVAHALLLRNSSYPVVGPAWCACFGAVQGYSVAG